MSVAADVRFYGMLKTLGTTRRQIRRLIYGQANRLCLIGIPAPSVGSAVEFDGVSYKVMAVTSVLDPVDKGSLEAGSEENRSSELCKFHGDGDRIPQKGICDDPERGNDEKAALPDAGF